MPDDLLDREWCDIRDSECRSHEYRERITTALAILNRVPDADLATMTRAQVREMWLAHHDACRALRPEPESGG